MTSYNQVSPVIRISREERDASARATHLKAASRKYLETTIERKQMSTTTNFKRIALVAVAALGLGVLSSVPSQAVINADNLAVSAGTATQTTAETLTSTSATATLRFVAGDVATDSMTLTASLSEGPAGSGTNLPYLTVKETTNASVNGSAYRTTAVQIGPNVAAVETAIATGSVSTTYSVYIASSGTAAPTVAGTYKVKLTPTLSNGGTPANAVAQYITITVGVAPTLDTTADATTSKSVIQQMTTKSTLTIAQWGTAVDSTVVTPAALGASNAAVQAAAILVTQLNAAGGAADESMTATISGPGTIGASNGTRSGTETTTVATGRSLTVKNGGFITVWNDGTAGVATITIVGATSGKTLSTEKVTFYGSVASFTATSAGAIVGPSATTNKAVTFLAKDSAANTLNDEGALDTWYAFSSDTSIATVGSPSYSVDSGTVAVTGVKAGSVTVTIGNASTLAASTIKSAPVTVRVGSTSIASVKVAFDKATYAPGEKAIITVSPLDASGLLVVPATTEIWSVGLATDKNFSQGSIPASDTTTVFAAATDATAGTTAGVKTYAVYMPSTPGTVKLTATLSKVSALAAAIQGTDLTASATVTDSGSAALAAVTALATTVASLRTLIVTLTNLVLKIQKKVKA
jgi:trimeric autotransporter adhesin